MKYINIGRTNFDLMGLYNMIILIIHESLSSKIWDKLSVINEFVNQFNLE